MHIQEQRAWFILIVMVITLLLYGGTVAVIGFKPEAIMAFSFAGLAGGANLIGRREKQRGVVISDERDREIGRQSVRIGFSFFWICFLVATLLPMYIWDPLATLSIRAGVLPAFGLPAIVLVYLVQSLTTVVLYRRGGHAE
jgi:uncharacterized membrane protein